LIVLVAFAEGLLMLLITQDFSGPMVMFDNYSIPLSLVVFVQLVAPAVAALLKNHADKKAMNNPPLTNATANAPTISSSTPMA